MAIKRHQISANLDALLRLQGLCVAIVAAVWAILWAADRPDFTPIEIANLVIYVLVQFNLTALALELLRFEPSDSPAAHHWLRYLSLLLASTAVVVPITVALVYEVNRETRPFADYLRSGWKFPVVANLVFWIGHEVYRVTKSRLEAHNRQLQRSIDTEIAEREQKAEELKQALEIQRGLLPKELPQLPGFAIAGAWEPARVVGGDYYDVIRLGQHKIAVCIADVAGKGISAALLMANVQAAVRAFASESASPSRVCSQINSVLCTNIAPGKFVTLFYAILDASTRILQFTNAGHLRPLLIPERAAAQHLQNDGALLGVFPDWNYQDSSIELQPGDLLLLFTDGITEAMAVEGEEFGEERILQTIADGDTCSVEDLQARVLEKVRQFCQGRLNDDATLLMIAAPRAGREEFALSNLKEQVLQHAGVSS